MRILFTSATLLVAASSIHSLTVQANEAELSTVQITASSQQTVANTRLNQEQIDQIKSTNLGETLTQLPGIQSSSMGQAVGRPVIRGLDGVRVQITENGLSSSDVSSISQDHGVSIEPFLADSIDVLKGARSLEYGSGHAGGVVNVNTGRIPTQLPEGAVNGRFESRFDSVSKGHTQMLRVDSAIDKVAVHVDGVYRKQQDYRTPAGTLDNSYIDTKTGAVGASFIDDWGFLGASVSRYLNDYGVPSEEGVYIPMEQNRYEVKGRLLQPFTGFQALDVEYAHTDYQHQEVEDEEVETEFTNQTNELRVQLQHNAIAGWQGKVGGQWSNQHFAALGAESFVPVTRTQIQGLFFYEQAQFNRLTVDFGARVDQHKKQADGMEEQRFYPVSVAAGFAWKLQELWDLTLELERNQRAPSDEELYANGPHHGSHTYEVGDSGLKEESANQVELGLHFQNYALEASVAVFANHYQDFIYLADTNRPDIDDLPQRDWQQQDAFFHGAEAQATFYLTENAHGRWSLNTYTDYVRATLKNNGNVPRMPATRVGAKLQWQNDTWYFDMGGVQYFQQNDIAAYETNTDSYHQINMHLNWQVFERNSSQMEVFLEGKNLTNQTIQPATSLFKDEVPLPGRNIAAGLRVKF